MFERLTKLLTLFTSIPVEYNYEYVIHCLKNNVNDENCKILEKIRSIFLNKKNGCVYLDWQYNNRITTHTPENELKLKKIEEFLRIENISKIFLISENNSETLLIMKFKMMYILFIKKNNTLNKIFDVNRTFFENKIEYYYNHLKLETHFSSKNISDLLDN